MILEREYMMNSSKTYNQKIKFINIIKKRTLILIKIYMQVISKYRIKFLIKMIKIFNKIIYLQDLLRMIFIIIRNMIVQIYFIIMMNNNE
jgi:hypothetical protein